MLPPLPSINLVRTKVNPLPPICHPPLMCHLPWCTTPHWHATHPLLEAVVYGDGWWQRSTLAFGPNQQLSCVASFDAPVLSTKYIRLGNQEIIAVSSHKSEGVNFKRSCTVTKFQVVFFCLWRFTHHKITKQPSKQLVVLTTKDCFMLRIIHFLFNRTCETLSTIFKVPESVEKLLVCATSRFSLKRESSWWWNRNWTVASQKMKKVGLICGSARSSENDYLTPSPEVPYFINLAISDHGM